MEYRGREAYLLFACQRDRCDGDVEVRVPQEPGDYTNTAGHCSECGTDHRLNVVEHAIEEKMEERAREAATDRTHNGDGEYTDPSESGLRSGKGTGLLCRLFRGDD